MCNASQEQCAYAGVFNLRALAAAILRLPRTQSRWSTMQEYRTCDLHLYRVCA